MSFCLYIAKTDSKYLISKPFYDSIVVGDIMTKKRTTLHNTIYNDIISKIQNGELKVGDKLPTEMELTKIYNVSRITVSHAMKDLAESNLIYRVRRGGTFVNGKINHNTPLVIPTILPFDENFNYIMKGAQNVALTSNVFTPFYNSKNNINRERDYLWEILENNSNGLIVYPCMSLANLDLYIRILAKKIPIVCIDRPIEGLSTPIVTTNNADSMHSIINRLVALGHTKIGFFSISDQMTYTEKERFKGFCSGLIDNNLPFIKEYIFNTSDLHKKEINLTQEQQNQVLCKYMRKELEKYLALEDKPTAVCCLNDSTLETLCRVATQMGIRIPEDLTVTGFDCNDTEYLRNLKYISIKQDFYKLGTTAITLMLKVLDGQFYRPTEFVEGILVNG